MLQASWSTKPIKKKHHSSSRKKTLPRRANEHTYAELVRAEVTEQQAIKRRKYYKIMKGYL